MAGEKIITVEAVIKAGDFGRLYFTIKADGTLTTSLFPSALICSDDITAVIVDISRMSTGLIIRCMKIENDRGIIFNLALRENMYVKTSATSHKSMKMTNVIYCLDEYVYLPSPHFCGQPLAECHGRIAKIFSYPELPKIFLLLKKEHSSRVVICHETYRAIQLQPDENISYLAAQLGSVSVGMSVYITKQKKIGVVLAVLYADRIQQVPLGYIIRTDDNQILEVDFLDRVIPVNPVLSNHYILRSYHTLFEETGNNEIFLHDGMALKTLMRTDEQHLVRTVRGTSHNFNSIPGLNLSLIYAYLMFDESIDWRKYGFTCEPRENKVVTCSRTGEVTSTDF